MRFYTAGDKFIMVMFEGDREAPPQSMPIEQAYKYIDLDRDIVKVLGTVSTTS